MPGCRYYYKLGGCLDGGDAFLIIRSWQDFRNRKLRIDYVVHKGFVKFYDEGDTSSEGDTSYFPPLSIYDIIAYRSLRPLAKVVRMLRKQVLDLRELRKASLLARYMRWMNLHAFRCCSRAVWQATTPHQCDSVWVRACMLIKNTRRTLRPL